MSDRSSSPSLPDTPTPERDDAQRERDRKLATEYFDELQRAQLTRHVKGIDNHLAREKKLEDERNRLARAPPRVPDLADLEGIVINRADLDELWETDDGLLGDDFFAIHAQNMVGSINLLVATHFKQGPISIPKKVSPWGMKRGPKEDTALEEYAQRVARPDMMHEQPWDMLLKEEGPRNLLLVGIFMRILDDHVFSRMLFGASEEQERQLQQLDEVHLEDEGFSRSRLRSASVNIMLRRSSGVPVQFWDSVDKLTHDIVMQLIPVLTYVWKSKPKEEHTLKRFYQHVHKQVAFAGWWAVQIRRSPAIVTFKWPIPGEPWQDRMEDVSGSTFLDSFAEIEMRGRWRNSAKEDKPEPIRRARVLIVASPEIRRYLPQINGHNDFRILRTFVACYYGLFFDNEDRDEFENHNKDPSDFDTDLVRYAQTQRQRRGEAEGRDRHQREPPPWLVSILLLLVLRWIIVRASEVNERDVWNRWIAPQVDRALREATANPTTTSSAPSATTTGGWW